MYVPMRWYVLCLLVSEGRRCGCLGLSAQGTRFSSWYDLTVRRRLFMISSMSRPAHTIRYKNPFLVAAILLLIGAMAGYSVGYYVSSLKHDPHNIPTENKTGYITTNEARNMVDNFYQQYLHPKKESPDEYRKLYVNGWGSKGLAFYNEYYRHGFDPIVCSSVMPTSVVAQSIETGAGAAVIAEAKYPDGSTENIVITLVLNIDGFKIDTITCAGDKGNLPPST